MEPDTIDLHRGLFDSYPDVLNIDQACRLLSVCDKTLYKLIREGRLPAIRLGRKYRVAKCHLVRLVLSAESQP